MIRWEFVSEMRLNSVSPSLDTSEIMKSTVYCRRERTGGGGGSGWGGGVLGIEYLTWWKGYTYLARCCGLQKP